MEEEYFSDSQDAEENKWENLNGVDVLDEYLNLLSVNENEEKAASSSIKKGKRKTSKNPSLSELLQVKNVWSLTIKQREEVHAYWQYLFEETRQGTINRLQVNLDQLLSEFKELKAQFNLKALKSKKVIGMTTTSSAKHLRLIQGVQPKIIICEEAGEILEAHILASLGRYVQHLILIGDHLQLRPHIREYSLNV
ncbi:NFX1-type zinc finger-containing protein 1, partial [Coelomomyces lativittatus]